jgi:hypothetical protein
MTTELPDVRWLEESPESTFCQILINKQDLNTNSKLLALAQKELLLKM